MEKLWLEGIGWAAWLWDAFLDATALEAATIVLSPGAVSVVGLFSLGVAYFIVKRGVS